MKNETLPDLNKIVKTFNDTVGLMPQLDNYSIFCIDQLGVGGFNFCKDVQQLKEVIQSFIFMNANADGGYDNYTEEELKALAVLSGKLLNCPDKIEDLKAWVLKEFTIPELEGQEIRFVGRVSELFEGTTEFSMGCIDDFELDPIENKEEYLLFLSEYGWM
jgi:hypothetical protein